MADHELPSLSRAELVAAIQRLDKLDAQKKLDERRARMGDNVHSSGVQLAPMSPSPSKKRASREALMHPVQTNTSSKLLASHSRNAKDDLYCLPRFRKESSLPSTSAHPAASSSSSRRHLKNGGRDLAHLLENEDANRLAPKQRVAPSSLINANDLARKRIKDADSRRGIANHRSTTFNDAAPKRNTQPVASTSTQPIPSYNTSYKSGGREHYSSSNNHNAYPNSSSTSRDYKGKAADRGRIPEQQQQAPPATRHAWQSRASTSHQDMNNTTKDEDYYSFEEEEGPMGDDTNDDDAYTEIPYKPIGNETNDDLTLVHRIKPGPKHFKSLSSDPNFESVEPNSKIRLSKRTLPHTDLQEHLSDRFYLPHDILYSIVRPSKGGLEYEVPVEGDWIVIGVLAEKSEIKYTGGGSSNGFNNGQNGAMKQIEMRKKMQEERKAKAIEKAKERARAQFRNNNGGGQDYNNSKPFDDSAFEEMIKSDDELKEAFQGSDGEQIIDTKNKKNRKDGKSNKVEEKEPPQRRRYITFKLIDLGKKNASSGTGTLSLKLFESDPNLRRNVKSANDSGEEETETVYNKKTGKKVLVTRSKREKKLSKKSKDGDHDSDTDNGEDGDRFERKEYKGGSGGAFEKYWKELNGTVVAILNPRIMKPWQNPYMQNSSNANVLAITPESADSVIVIGKSKDLGSCQARKKDGALCLSWCDTRVDNVCDYHIAQAVNRRRAGRSELLSGTGGMQTTHVSRDITSLHSQNKPSGRMFSGGSSHAAPYDPVNKIGLLPRNNTSVQEGSKTYVVSTGGLGASRTGGYRTAAGGGSASTMSNGHYRPGVTNSMQPTYNDNSGSKKALDPEEAARKRKREKQSIEQLLALEGGKSVGATYLSTKAKTARSDNRTSVVLEEKNTSSGMDGEDDSATSQNELDKTKKRVFGVGSLRKIGFDPTYMPALTDAKQQKRKMEAMQVLGNPDTYQPQLGRHAGKGHSNVHKPQASVSVTDNTKNNKGKEDSTYNNDEEENSDDPRPPKRRSVGTSKQDHVLQDSSSDNEHAIRKVKNKHVARMSVSDRDCEEEEQEDSDLEIEPPAAT